MSAPQSLGYDVLFNGNKISKFSLDADLDSPVEIFEEVCKLFTSDGHWFDAKILFRFSEHIYYATLDDFVLKDVWYRGYEGELRLVLTDCKDWG